MVKEQEMQVKKLHEQCINPATKQTSIDAKFAPLETKFGTKSQSKEVDVEKTDSKTPKEPAWSSNRGNPVVTCQASGVKHKEPS